MLFLVLAASLNVFAPATEPPQPAEVKEAPLPRHKVKLKDELSSKPYAKEEAAAKAQAKEDAAARAKVKEEGGKAEKPAARHKLASPAVPDPDAPEPVKHVHVFRAPRKPAPAAAAPVPPGSLSLDVRAAHLEAENARLRAQLALTGRGRPATIADPDSALAELVGGNQRFVEGARVRTQLSSQDSELRASLVESQAPFAVIITCSDSRLADNLIFDQELGRLFTIREAGNSPDTQSLASVEYALEHLGSKLVVVMGHVGCGAVKAVYAAHGQPLPGNLWSLQAAMSGLLESTPEDPNEAPAAHMYHLVEHNAQRQAQAVLDRSDLVRERVAKHRVRIVPAVYDLASGKVTFLAAPAVAPEPTGHP